MTKAIALFYQGFSDEEIIKQLEIDEETLSLIKERQQRMMKRAQEMSAMYGSPLPQQFSTTNIPTPEISTPEAITPVIPTQQHPIMPKQRKKRHVFFKKKQVVIFLIGLTLAIAGAVIMGMLSMPYTFFWWLIILEIIGVNVIFQIVFGIVAFRAKFGSRTYTGIAAADYDGDGKYDEVAMAEKTISGTDIKLKALAITLLIFILITIGILTQFNISVQAIGPQADIVLGGEMVLAFFVLHGLGALVGGYGLTRG